MTQGSTYRVGVLLLDGFAMMSFSAAVEPFRAANRLAGQPLYRVEFIARTAAAQSSAGAQVLADHRIGTTQRFDLVMVVAGSDVQGQALVAWRNDEVFDWLRRQSRQPQLLAGVSGGPAVLALAGVMTDRRMTIHWDHAEPLAELMPELRLERSLYVRDRDRLTCAGGIAPLDMLHALIAEHHGAKFARRVSDWFLHTDIRASGAPQRSGMAERFNVSSKPLLSVLELMENHLADPLDLAQLASVAGLSKRQLNRLCTDKLGLSTIAFYRQLRLEHAQRLLTQSAMSVAEIADATGFCDAAHLGRHLRTQYGVSPQKVRQSAASGLERTSDALRSTR